MTAEVSSLARMLGRYLEKKREAVPDKRSRDLVTRDFLGGGGCSPAPAKELDLEFAAPAGWERRLDLTSGEVFLQRTGPSTAPATAVVSNAHTPPPLLPLFPSPPLDLALLPPSSGYQSVCTLDKVKSALDRLASAAPATARKATHTNNRSHSSSASASPPRSASASGSCSRSGSPTSFSTTASSQKQHHRHQIREGGESGTTTEEDAAEAGGPAAMLATGCPSCLSYVLISRTRPRCPRCAADISPPPTKKPRLDLNLNSSSSPAGGDGAAPTNFHHRT